MRSWTNRSAAATVVKNVASVSARVLRCAALNGVRMLVEASIISAMRRPGIRHVAAHERGERIGQRQDEERQARRGTAASGTCRRNATARRRHRRQERRHDEPMTARPAARATERAISSSDGDSATRPMSTSRASLRCQNCRSARRSARQSSSVSARRSARSRVERHQARDSAGAPPRAVQPPQQRLAATRARP